MNRRRILLMMALLGAAGACVSNPMPATGPAGQPPRLDLEAPLEVASFPLEQTRQLSPAEAGVHYGYEAPGLQGPDVFIYPMNRQLLEMNPYEAAHRETGDLRRILPMQRAQGLFDSFNVLLDETIDVPTDAGRVPGHHLIASLTKDGQSRYSHQILLVMYGNYVKIRITYPASLAPATKVIEFTEDLAQKLEDSVPDSVPRVRPVPAGAGGVQL